MLFLSDGTSNLSGMSTIKDTMSTIVPAGISITEKVVAESGVVNAVSGIIFRNRLYDTIFEVIVFTIAILGCNFFISQ